MKTKLGSNCCRYSASLHGAVQSSLPLGVSRLLVYHVALATLLIHTVCVTAASLEDRPRMAEVTDNRDKLKTGSEIRTAVFKRAAPQSYNFGLGKRNPFEDGNDLIDEYTDLDVKRAASDKFAFGLGKRADSRFGEPARFNFGLGKREAGGEVFAFDAPEKRAPLQKYQFGLGKKAASNRYSFGLGKREARRSSFEDLFKRKYSFGLGKRR